MSNSQNHSETRPVAPPLIPELKVDSLKFGLMFALVLTALQRIVGLVRGILFCRILPEEQLGQWSLTWSYLMLMAPLAVLGLPGSFNRYVELYRQRGQLKSFLYRIAGISLVMTVSFSILLYLFAGQVSHWLFRDSGQSRLVMVMAVCLILVTAFNFLTSLLEALRQVRLVTVMRFVNGVAFAALAIVFLLQWENGTEAVTIGFAASCFVATLPAIWYFRKNWSIIETSQLPLPQKSMWQRVAPFAAWLWIINLVSNLYEVADRNMLLHLTPGSPTEAQALVGQYHSGRIIPLVLVGLAAMLGGILMSYMTASWERGEKEKVSQQLRWTLKLTGLGFTWIGIAVLVLSPFLFDVVLQGKYNGGLAVLPMTLVYCIWYGLVTVGQDYLWCREKGKWACLAVITGLAINVVLNLFLIPRFGLTGAVWATATSNLFALVALFWINHCFGWKPDRGVLLAAAVPILLLLPVHLALTSTLMISWAGYRFGWMFDERERMEMSTTFNSFLHRFWPRWMHREKTSV